MTQFILVTLEKRVMDIFNNHSILKSTSTDIKQSVSTNLQNLDKLISATHEHQATCISAKPKVKISQTFPINGPLLI